MMVLFWHKGSQSFVQTLFDSVVYVPVPKESLTNQEVKTDIDSDKG